MAIKLYHVLMHPLHNIIGRGNHFWVQINLIHVYVLNNEYEVVLTRSESGLLNPHEVHSPLTL